MKPLRRKRRTSHKKGVRTLKRIGKIITAVGVGIMFFGGMCDADGIYYYYLIAVIALGALVSLAGLAILAVELR